MADFLSINMNCGEQSIMDADSIDLDHLINIVQNQKNLFV